MYHMQLTPQRPPILQSRKIRKPSVHRFLAATFKNIKIDKPSIAYFRFLKSDCCFKTALHRLSEDHDLARFQADYIEDKYCWIGDAGQFPRIQPWKWLMSDDGLAPIPDRVV